MSSSSTNGSKGNKPDTPAGKDEATKRDETASAAGGKSSTAAGAGGEDRSSGSPDSPDAGGTAASRARQAEPTSGGAPSGSPSGSEGTDRSKSDPGKGSASGSPATAGEKAAGGPAPNVTPDARADMHASRTGDTHQADRAAQQQQSGLSEIADQAKSAASGAAAAARDKAEHVMSGASDELERAIDERKDEGAQQLHRVAEAIVRASGELREELPLVASYVKRGATKVDALAETIRQRDGSTLAADARDFVVRRPGMVGGVLALAGFAGVRFLMAASPQSRSHTERNEGGTGRDGHEAAGRPRAGSGTTNTGTASGDPGGTSPRAPGFEKSPGTGS